MNPTLSIVTPALNQARFLELTLKSVIDQHCDSLEYRVLDGGSKDGSLELLKQYGSRISWTSEPDLGQADALNKGFRSCHGDILGWLNADDVYCPGALQEVVRQFQADSDLMLLYGKAHHIDEEGNFLEDYPTRDFDLSILASHCFICQPACFFRRSLLDACGGLETGLQYAMDLDLWIRMGKLQRMNSHWKFRHIPQVLALSRMHRDNKTLSRRRLAFEEIISVVERHFGIVPFNWVYGAEESASGRYDGYFRKSPLHLSLLGKSFLRWLWMNRKSPRYSAGFILGHLLSPQRSLRSLTQRTRAIQ